MKVNPKVRDSISRVSQIHLSYKSKSPYWVGVGEVNICAWQRTLLAMVFFSHKDMDSHLGSLLSQHGSLEGVGGLKTNEAYHSKADALLIPEMYFFLKIYLRPFLEMFVL